MGLAAVVLVTAVGASVTKVPMLFASPTYYGQFSDTGGLMVGDYVRIDGVNVGTVKDMDIDRDKVIIGFDIGTNTIGTDSRALIKTETILGRRRYLPVLTSDNRQRRETAERMGYRLNVSARNLRQQRTRTIAVVIEMAPSHDRLMSEPYPLSLLGGIIGLVLGGSGSYAASRVLDIPFTLPPQSAALAVAVSVFVGVVFGVFPARKAARFFVGAVEHVVGQQVVVLDQAIRRGGHHRHSMNAQQLVAMVEGLGRERQAPSFAVDILLGREPTQALNTCWMA